MTPDVCRLVVPCEEALHAATERQSGRAITVCNVVQLEIIRDLLRAKEPRWIAVVAGSDVGWCPPFVYGRQACHRVVCVRSLRRRQVHVPEPVGTDTRPQARRSRFAGFAAWFPGAGQLERVHLILVYSNHSGMRIQGNNHSKTIPLTWLLFPPTNSRSWRKLTQCTPVGSLLFHSRCVLHYCRCHVMPVASLG